MFSRYSTKIWNFDVFDSDLSFDFSETKTLHAFVSHPNHLDDKTQIYPVCFNFAHARSFYSWSIITRSYPLFSALHIAYFLAQPTLSVIEPGKSCAPAIRQRRGVVRTFETFTLYRGCHFLRSPSPLGVRVSRNQRFSRISSRERTLWSYIGLSRNRILEQKDSLTPIQI